MDKETYRVEAEYIIYLLHERRLFAWCLMRYGEFDVAEAYREAAKLYPYYSAIQMDREDVFHEEAWHWAMVKLFGNNYTKEYPTLAHPPYEYQEESDRIFGYE